MDRPPAPSTPPSPPVEVYPTLEGNRGPSHTGPFSNERAEAKVRRSPKRKQTLIQLHDGLATSKEGELDSDTEQDVPVTQDATERIKALPMIVDDRLQADAAQSSDHFDKTLHRSSFPTRLTMQNSERDYETEPYRQALAEVLRSMDDRRISPGDLVFSEHYVGAGAFGKVIRGLWQRTDNAGAVSMSPVAIKLLQIKRHTFLRLALRFARELKLWATFEHPNVLAFLGFHVDPDHNEAWFVSPYLAGGNIHSRLNTDATITFEQRTNWVVDVTEGLAYLHSMTPPVAHGDLKSENILLDDQDSAVICDFGLSIVVEDSVTTGLTTSDSCGSVRWCSPELIDNEKRSTHSDIWAWALCVLEITTGRLPFYGARNEVAIYGRILGLQCPTRDEYPELPPDNHIWETLQKCFRKNPLERPSAHDCLVEVSRPILTSTSGGPKEERPGYGTDTAVLATALNSPESIPPTSPADPASAALSTSPVTFGVGADARKKFMQRTGLAWVTNVPTKNLKRATTWGSAKLSKASTMAYEAVANAPGRVSTTVLPHGGSSTSGDSGDNRDEYAIDGGVLPVALNSPRSMQARRLSEASAGSGKSRHPRPSPIHPVILEDQLPVSSSSDNIHAGPFGHPTPPKPLPISLEELGSALLPISPAISPARARFRAAVQKVIESQRLSRPTKPPIPTAPAPKSSNTEENFAPRSTRLAVVVLSLKKLQPTQHLTKHSGLVRHLQFSPDGKWLATCSWDRTAIIWRVGEQFQTHKVLAHPGAGFISQVAWSPDGKYLLTKMHKAVKVWIADTGVLFKTISRNYHVDAVAWLPSGRAFASIEHDHIDIVDLQGAVLDTHFFKQMQIHDVSFTPDEERMLLVGTLKFSKKGLQASKSRAEKRILVYDLADKKVENQVPVLENVRDVSIGSDGALALVSYEDRAPPEVWAIDIVANEGRLRLLNTYMPTAPVDFAGPSYFGGVEDQFVICAGKKGDIHIWDRETGLLLHSLQGANIVDGGTEDLTGIAWNHHAPGQFMFASATHDGTVRIWTAPAPLEMAPPSRAESPGPMGTQRSLNTGGISIAT